jgi:hypothetical protein
VSPPRELTSISIVVPPSGWRTVIPFTSTATPYEALK